MISDLVLSRDLPADVAGSLAAYAGCIAGALRKDEYLRLMEKAGFREVRVVRETLRDAARAVLSVQVFGRKPAQADFVKP